MLKEDCRRVLDYIIGYFAKKYKGYKVFSVLILAGHLLYYGKCYSENTLKH